jgi:hypothetical protein
MHPIYCTDPAIQTAIATALDVHGLWPDPSAVTHRPRCADRLDHQLARVERSIAVLETVRCLARVDEPTRRLIERLVDSASIAIEGGQATSSDGALPPVLAAPVDVCQPRVIQSRRAATKAVPA